LTTTANLLVDSVQDSHSSNFSYGKAISFKMIGVTAIANCSLF
jgi:hypothetical protein